MEFINNKKILLVSIRHYNKCFYSDKLNFFGELIEEKIDFKFISYDWTYNLSYIVNDLISIIDNNNFDILYFLNDSFNIISSDISVLIIEKLRKKYGLNKNFGIQYYDEKFIVKNDFIDQYYLGKGGSFGKAINSIKVKRFIKNNNYSKFYKKIDLNNYIINLNTYKYFVIESNSFCKYNCSFCNKSDKEGIKFSVLSKEQVFIYLNIAKKNNFSKIWFMDPSFNENENFKDILNLCKKYSFSYTFEIRAETFGENDLSSFKGLNIDYFNVGLQSISKEVALMTKRFFLKKKYEKGISLMKKVSKVNIDLILGLPGETIKTFMETVKYVNNLNGKNFRVFLLEKRPNSFKNNDKYIKDIYFDQKYPYKVKYNKWISGEEIILVKKFCQKYGIDFN